MGAPPLAWYTVLKTAKVKAGGGSTPSASALQLNTWEYGRAVMQHPAKV